MDYKEILYTIADGVALIVLNHPEKQNAESSLMQREWAEAVQKSDRDPGVKALIVPGAGRAFCAGKNPRELLEMADNPVGGVAPNHSLQEAVDRLQKPYIAAVNGAAIGGGMDAASMCDIRIASESAVFGMGYVRMGLIPAQGGCYYLPRIVGLANALELIWTGRIIDSQEALRIGYVSKVVPHKDLMPTTLGLARSLAQGPTVAINLSKRLSYQGLTSTLDAAISSSDDASVIARRTQDAQEGPRAFLEKRTPRFKGS